MIVPFHILYVIWFILIVIQIYLIYRINKQTYLLCKVSFGFLSLDFFRFIKESVKIQKTTKDDRLRILLYLIYMNSFVALSVFFLCFFGVVRIQ